MAIFETEGIVLKQFDLGESDKIITFYTKSKGKLRAVARGARKTKSNISGLVLPFSYNQLSIYQGRSLASINQINNKFSFSLLREDLTKMAYGLYMAEFVEKVGMEDNPNQDLFSLLLYSFYQLLKKSEDRLDYLLLSFKFQILKILGIEPELNSCVKCKKKSRVFTKNFFLIKDGGLLCPQCLKKQYVKVDNLSGESLQLMIKFFQKEFNSLKNIKISVQALNEIDKLLNKFIVYHLDLKLNSLEFLHMIKNLG